MRVIYAYHSKET